jgi:hypothetical protein
VNWIYTTEDPVASSGGHGDKFHKNTEFLGKLSNRQPLKKDGLP